MKTDIMADKMKTKTATWNYNVTGCSHASGVKRKIRAKPPPAKGLLEMHRTVRAKRQDHDPDFDPDPVNSSNKKKKSG